MFQIYLPLNSNKLSVSRPSKMLHLKQGCFVREPKKNYIKKGYHHHSTNDVNRDGGKSENMKGEISNARYGNLDCQLLQGGDTKLCRFSLKNQLTIVFLNRHSTDVSKSATLEVNFLCQFLNHFIF